MPSMSRKHSIPTGSLAEGWTATHQAKENTEHIDIIRLSAVDSWLILQHVRLVVQSPVNRYSMTIQVEWIEVLSEATHGARMYGLMDI